MQKKTTPNIFTRMKCVPNVSEITNALNNKDRTHVTSKFIIRYTGRPINDVEEISKFFNVVYSRVFNLELAYRCGLKNYWEWRLSLREDCHFEIEEV